MTTRDSTTTALRDFFDRTFVSAEYREMAGLPPLKETSMPNDTTSTMPTNPTTAKTYQFFYVSFVDVIKWKLDGETTDLIETMLSDRQKEEVAALWGRIKPNSILTYDHVRDWNTGNPVVKEQPA